MIVSQYCCDVFISVYTFSSQISMQALSLLNNLADIVLLASSVAAFRQVAVLIIDWSNSQMIVGEGSGEAVSMGRGLTFELSIFPRHTPDMFNTSPLYFPFPQPLKRSSCQL